MAVVGNFGQDIVFQVSDEQVLTFQEMNKAVKGRWGKVTPIYGKPTAFFQGMEHDSVTMRVQLSAGLGVSPAKVIARIEEAVESGRADYLVLGHRLVCKGKMRITQLSEAFDIVWKGGGIYQATLRLTFEEYT
jgi:hypothetical protein